MSSTVVYQELFALVMMLLSGVTERAYFMINEIAETYVSCTLYYPSCSILLDFRVLCILKYTFLQSVVSPYSHVVGPVPFDFFSVFSFSISDVLLLLILCS